MNPLLEYVYITDKESFYNRKARRPISEMSFVDKLRKWNSEYESAERVLETLRLLKSRGIKFRDLDEGSADTESLYAEVKEILPFYWVASTEGQEFLYFVSETKEVTLLLGDGIDGLLGSLKANKEAYEKVFNAFSTSDILQKANSKMELKTYLQRILDRLRLDPDKQLPEKPKLLSWEPSEFAFKKFDPSQLDDFPCPTWDQFCARLDYPEIFQAWVWSVFEPSNDGRQLLWIRGTGNDGKSRVLSALMQIYGTAYTASLVNGDVDSQFFYSKIYGKRLTIYDDCKNPRLISSEKVHSILGKGVVSVEHKFGQPFTAEIFSKILVGSNYFPEIDFFRNNEKSRLLCLTVQQYGNGSDADARFTEKLIEEQYGFLFKCKRAYEKHCLDGVMIQVSPEMLEVMKENCASENSKTLEEFINDKIIFTEEAGAIYERGKLYSDLVQYLLEAGLNWQPKFAMNDLKKILEDRKIKQVKLKVRGKLNYVYVGIKPAEPTASHVSLVN